MTAQHRAWAGPTVAAPSASVGRHRAVLTARPPLLARARPLGLGLLVPGLLLLELLSALGVRRRRALARARGRLRVHAHRHCWQLRPLVTPADVRDLLDAALITELFVFVVLGVAGTWRWLS